MSRAVIAHRALAVSPFRAGLRMDHRENERLRGIRSRCGCRSCRVFRARVTEHATSARLHTMKWPSGNNGSVRR